MKHTLLLTFIVWGGIAGQQSALAQPAFFSEIEVVSAAAPGDGATAANGFSDAAVVSADGRFVAFMSQADNLAPNDLSRSLLGSYFDVFVRELATGKTTLVSVTPDGATGGNSHSGEPSLSADGRYVAFESEASDLVPNDANSTTDVFVRDLITRQTQLVSVRADGSGSGRGASTNPTLTPDGRFVVFESQASDLVADGTASVGDVFVRDLQTGVTTLVSAAAAGEPASGRSQSPVITPDGRYVAFASVATNLVPGTLPSEGEIYLRDLTGGTTTRVSVNAATIVSQTTGFALTNRGFVHAANGNPQLSTDGRFVAFKCSASVPATTNFVFRHNLQTEETTLIARSAAVASTGLPDLLGPSMSADGSRIVYTEQFTTSDRANVQVWDAQTGTTSLVSVKSDGSGPATGLSDTPTVSADGRFVAFVSSAPDLVPTLPTEASRSLCAT
jgi:Tol biopolymer transport system component